MASLRRPRPRIAPVALRELGRLVVRSPFTTCSIAATLFALSATPAAGAWPPSGVVPTLHATARTSQKRVLPYPMPHVWPAAIRYLRVDRNYVVVDRDEQLGFVLFDVPLEGERVGRGSLELVAMRDAAGRDGVQLEIAVDGGPLHLPFTLLDGIANKVKHERGQPPPPPPPPAPAPPPEDPNDVPLMPPSEPP